jgi:hypothetical protein
MRHRSPLVDLANEHVRILDVCRWVEMRVPDGTPPRSLKVHCPFGVEAHTDHGSAPAMRVYPDTNQTFCFSCGYFSPVWLAACVWKVNAVEAAQMLLDRIGYQPASVETLWALALAEVVPDTASLGQALQTYCGRVDSHWSTRQFESLSASMLDRCLSLLSHVRTAEQAQTWLTSSKLIMSRVIGGDGHGRERGTAAGELDDFSRRSAVNGGVQPSGAQDGVRQ